MAERESAHRHEMEKRELSVDKDQQDKQFDEARLGQVLGFAIGAIAIISGLYASIKGAQWFGSIVGGGGVVGLVSAFICGRSRKFQKNETEPNE